MVSFNFSCDYEIEVDEYLVIYFCGINYNVVGVVGFFCKMEGEGGCLLEFLLMYFNLGNCVEVID